MLPPLFAENTLEPITPELPVAPIVPDLRPSVDSSYKTFSAGLWLLGGVFAAVFVGLLVLVVSVFSMNGSVGDTVTLSGRSAGANGGQVFGSWTSQYKPAQAAAASGPFDAVRLAQSLEQKIAQHPKHSLSVVVAPVGEGQQVRIDDDAVMPGASTTKLLAAAAILSQIDAGKLTMESVAYQAIIKSSPAPTPESTGSAEAKEDVEEVKKPVKVAEALRLMINRSDNGAWENLIRLVGSKNLQTYANELGMKQYNVKNNNVTAGDMALLLQKLYSGQLLSDTSTKHLLTLMQNTNEERMLPAGLDEVGAVYHKYGWLGSNVHDVGVADNNGQPVVVIIMTDGSDNYSSRMAIVRELAQEVERSLMAGRK
jgi:beta-lactamase class A